MPKKGKTSNTNKVNGSKVKLDKKRPLLIVLIALIIVVFVAICGVYINGTIQDNAAQSNMKEYLKNKYGKEFTVEKPQRKASGFGVEGYLESVAYQSDDKSLKFLVRKSSDYIGDGYVGAVWTKSEKERILPVIYEIFGNDVHVDIEIETFGTARGNLPISGEIPTFREGAEKYGRAILYTLYIKSEDSLKGKESEASKKVFDLLPSISRGTDILFSYRSQAGSISYGIPLNQDDIKDVKKADDLIIMFREW